MCKSKDRKPHEKISARNIKRCESKRCKTKSALTNGEVAVFSRKSAACAHLSFKYAQAANDSVFGLIFVLEAFVTLPNGIVSTNTAGTALDLKVLVKSGFTGGYNITANEQWKDANGFERWCRDQGLLIEINDADYAEPKLAIVS